MRKALSISLVLAVALAGSAFAKPVDTSGDLDKFMYLDLSNPGQNLKGASQTGVFGAAAVGTTFFGGTTFDAGHAFGPAWVAIEDSCWTFDSGVGSDFNNFSSDVNPFKDPSLHTHMEGWVGFDVSFGGSNPYFRRFTDVDAAWSGAPGVCVGSGIDASFGTASFWCGATETESLAGQNCFFGGQGYGNGWNVSIFRSLAYSGSGTVTVAYDYFVNTEPGFDFCTVGVDTSGVGDDVITVQSFDGPLGLGSDSIVLTPGVDMRSSAGSFQLLFVVGADGAYSDEDGLYITTCGAFTVDNIVVSGGASHSCDFEVDECGWALSPAVEGAGGEWSDLVHLSDLPAPLTPCTCDLTDTVLVLQDLTIAGGGHGLFQDNLVASPWIDLVAAGLDGSPGKYIENNLYAELPLLNYVFVQFNVQWFPQTCGATGGTITSPWTSNGFVYYFGGVPQCTVPGAVAGTRTEFSEIMDPGAQQVRMALGVIAYCRFFGNCTGVTNSTPWFDEAKFAVYGSPDAPFLNASTIDTPYDSFPQNGTLRLDAPGRVDCNNVKGDSQPEPGTSLGDTLVVAGGLPGAGLNVGAEVWIEFAVDPGPGATGVGAWLTSHNSTGSANGQTWYEARMDTSLQGEVTNPATWCTLYHESDSHHSGNQFDPDPNDPDPSGQNGRKLNDMFPEGSVGLFTAGTRINMFYKTRYVDVGGTPTTGVWFTFPDTSGGTYLEMEVLPSSAEADSSWNCVLYVDHFDGRGAQPFIEGALGAAISGTSGNYEGTPWDRWDVSAPSSQQSSFGRPLSSDYGASVNQTFAYKMIVWNSGNLGAFNIVEEDANVLRPWLNLNDVGLGFNNLYASGDGVAQSITGEAATEPSALQMLELDMSVSFVCGTVRDPACNGSASASLEACIDVVPLGGDFAGNGGAHWLAGNGCPQLRSFDRIDIAGGGTGIANEKYISDVAGDVLYHSISNTLASSGSKTVLDGGSVHYREDNTGGLCDGTGRQASVDDRVNRVLDWMGYGTAQLDCVDPTTALDVPGPRDGGNNGFITALAAGRPNPYQGRGVVTLGFSLGTKGQATLEVFDVSGRLVKTVVDAVYDAGQVEVTWDATDNAGNSVASGVYFYRLKANGYEFAKKLIVVSNGGN